MSADGMNLDNISLEQALLDFEVANARVIDLTSRLTTASKELLTSRGTAELERTRNAQLRQEIATLQADITILREECGKLKHAADRSQERAYILSQLAQSRSLRLMSMFARRLRSALTQAQAASQ